jgi:cell division transport system permease protein
MKISSLSYLIRQGLKNIWRNRLMSITAIGVLTVCLVMVGAAELLSLNINNLVDFVQRENEMVVFLQDGLDEETAVEIGAEIKANDNVDQITYVSSAEAMEEQRKALGENGDLLDGLDSDLLPAKYVVSVRQISEFEETVSELSKIDGVMSVSAATDIASTLTDVGKMVSTFGIAVIAALAIIAVVIIVNTIKATIFSRRKEINIMRYVGATNAFIRIPFVIEGMVLGTVSAILSIACVALGYQGILRYLMGEQTGWLQSAFQQVVPFESVALPLGGGFLTAGILIGVFGSMISMRKYVKV